MAPSSARARAPASTRRPEKAQMAMTRPGSGTRRAMRLGTTKRPEPMTEPMSRRAPSASPSFRGRSLTDSLGNTVELRRGSNQEASPGDGGSRERDLIERVPGHHPELRPRLDHVGHALLAQAEDLSVVRPGRGGESPGHRVDALLVVDRSSRPGIVARSEEHTS